MADPSKASSQRGKRARRYSPLIDQRGTTKALMLAYGFTVRMLAA
jgi:hypothetical protein